MDYERRYKALCYLLHMQFDENGFRFSMFDETQQDILVGCILDGTEDMKEAKECYEEMKAIMDRC